MGWLVGVLGWSLRLGGASWGSWVGAVKNDTNFQGGYAYAVAAPLAPSGGLGQKNRPARPGFVQSGPRPCPIPVQYGAGASDSKGSQALRTC